MTGVLGMIGGKWKFQGWYQDGKLISVATTESITMDGPARIVARWGADYTTFLMIAAVVVIAITTFLAYIRRRKKSSMGEEIPER